MIDNLLVESFKMSAQQYASPLGRVDATNPKSIEEAAKGIHDYAESLYKKYEKYIGDMPNSWTKKTVAICMENWSRATSHLKDYLDEATVANNVTNFDKFAFPLLRTVLPALSTEKAFTIQPMLGPTSQIFTFQPAYGTTNGVVTAGTPLFGNNLDKHYGDNQIDEETVATGDGSTTTFSPTMTHLPITPGTVSFTDGTQIVSDDGSGNLTGDGSGTINYTNGAISLTFTVAPASGEPITVTYALNNETNADAIPEIDLILTATNIVARRKALRFRYSLTAQFALRDQYGIEAEAELMTATGAEISYGIDAVNFGNVMRVAMNKTADSTFKFTRTAPTGVSITEHKFGIVDYLIKGSRYILSQSGRAFGNWVLCTEEIVNIIESIGAPRFKAAPFTPTRGIQVVGVLDDRWTIMQTINPAHIGLAAGEYLIGYKAPDFLFAGYVWAPWIAMFTTPSVVLDDLQSRKAVASLYGQKVINAKYYLKMATNP